MSGSCLLPVQFVTTSPARVLPPGFAPASQEGGGPVQRDGLLCLPRGPVTRDGSHTPGAPCNTARAFSCPAPPLHVRGRGAPFDGMGKGGPPGTDSALARRHASRGLPCAG